MHHRIRVLIAVYNAVDLFIDLEGMAGAKGLWNPRAITEVTKLHCPYFMKYPKVDKTYN